MDTNSFSKPKGKSAMSKFRDEHQQKINVSIRLTFF